MQKRNNPDEPGLEEQPVEKSIAPKVFFFTCLFFIFYFPFFCLVIRAVTRQAVTIGRNPLIPFIPPSFLSSLFFFLQPFPFYCCAVPSIFNSPYYRVIYNPWKKKESLLVVDVNGFEDRNDLVPECGALLKEVDSARRIVQETLAQILGLLQLENLILLDRLVRHCDGDIIALLHRVLELFPTERKDREG